MAALYFTDNDEQASLYWWILGFNLMYFVLYFMGVTLNFSPKTFEEAKQHPFANIGAFGWLTHFVTCLIWPWVGYYIKVAILFNFYEIMYPFMVVTYANYLSENPVTLIVMNCLHHYGLTVMLLLNGNDRYMVNIGLSMIWVLHLTNCQLLAKKWRDDTESIIFIISSVGTYLIIFMVPCQSIFDILSLTSYIASRFYFYRIVERLSKSKIKLWFRNAEFWLFGLRIVLTCGCSLLSHQV